MAMSGHIGFIFSTATFSAKVLPACTAGEKAVACPLCTASYHVTQHSCQKAKVTVAHIRCLLDFLHDLEFSMLFNLNCMIVGRLVRRYDDLPIMRGLKEQVRVIEQSILTVRPTIFWLSTFQKMIALPTVFSLSTF